jgi:hypothetical protein
MKNRLLISNCSILFLFIFSLSAHGQECQTLMKITLVNQRGGFFTNQKVVLTSASDGAKYEGISDINGKAEIGIPCSQVFHVAIANYTHELEFKSAAGNGGWISRTVTYAPDMEESDKFFAMSEVERQSLNDIMKMIPDTNKFSGSMRAPYDIGNYSKLTIILTDLKDGPLADEQVTMTGENRNKSFQGYTSKNGLIQFYLPKGDNYSVNFKHNKNYSTHAVRYDKGTSEGKMQLSYMGSKEFELRKKELEEKMRIERERMEKEREAFIVWCKSEGITEDEGYIRKMETAAGGNSEKVVTKVLERNNWSEKLIVCDLTGSMLPYAAQLSVWYQLNVKIESNLQFVFFNDGDGTPDHLKLIGKTGGIYYQRANGISDLVTLMSEVQRKGCGGDGPENNMEALIEGVKLAGPYKELVMIVDNNANVKDLSLLNKFNRPVHIILCGASSGRILEDYLQIAWKTKGTIHTMENDLTELAKMADGETIKVNNITYKIMGGQFVRITED